MAAQESNEIGGDDAIDSSDANEMDNTNTMFWSGLQMGGTSLYEEVTTYHNGVLSDEDIADLVIDRLTPEERELSIQIAKEEDLESLKELLASPLCSPKVIDHIQERSGKRGGQSCLLQSARLLQVDKARLLLEAGCNPNINDLFDDSAMHWFLYFSSSEREDVREFIKLLIEFGYDTTCVNWEKKMTAFELRTADTSLEEDDKFGEGIYEVFDVVPWSEIESAILMDAESDGEDDHQIAQVVRRLVDLGWGVGADKNAVKGKERRENGGVLIRDRLQIVNQVSAPRNEKILYLYYWDDRDGSSYEGWWVTEALGSNKFYFSNIGRNDVPPRKGNWSKPETDFVPVYDGEVDEGSTTENAQVVGYRLENPGNYWNGTVFELTEQVYHGKPVYCSGEQKATKLEDRCTLLVEKVLLPLLRLAGQERLEDTDEAPCKAFARYLLGSRIASVCKEKVIEAANEGLDSLEKVLQECYAEVGQSLDSSCGPKKAMVGPYREWGKMNQRHVHGDLDWMQATGDEFLWKSVVVLCREGYTCAEICDAFSAFGWTSKTSYRSGAYALWLIKVAERCNENLIKAIEARIAQKEEEENGMNARIHLGPIKGYRRIFEKRSDYSDHVYNGRNHDVGGVADIARLSLSCDTPDDMIHCFNAITEANIDEHGFEVVRIKNGFSAENLNPKGGYRDVKFNLRVRGPEGGHDTIAEVQLLLQKFIDVKKHMHLLYEVVRGSYF